MSFLSVEEDSAEGRFRRAEGAVSKISLPELRPLVQGQSRKMSAVESFAGTAVGFGINTSANYFLLPLFGLYPTVHESMAIAVMFTLISLARGYVLRRIFNAI